MMDKALLYAILKNKSGAEISASGNPVTLSSTLADNPLKDCKIYGWSKQDGDPTPENPVEIESAGMKWSTGAQFLNLRESDIRPNTGLTATLQDGALTVSGTPAAAYIQVVAKKIQLEPGIYYASGGKKEAGYVYSQINIKRPDGTWNYLSGTAIYIDGTEQEIQYVIQTLNTGTAIENYTIYPMLNAGNTALPWEPYTGGIPKLYGDKVNVEVHGKNLMDFTKVPDVSDLYQGWKIPKKDYESATVTLFDNDVTADISQIFFGFTKKGTDATGGYKWMVNNGRIEKRELNDKFGYLSIFPTDAMEKFLQRFKILVEIGDKYTDYEPYHEPQSLSIQTPTGLPAIPVDSGGNYTDANGQQWVADYIDLKRGKYVQKLKSFTVEDIKALYTWGVNKSVDNITGFYLYMKDNGFPKSDSAVMASTILRHNNNAWGGKAVGCAVGLNTYKDGYVILSVPTHELEDISSDKNACASLLKICENTNAIFFYSMASPIERDLTPSEIQAYKELVTYAGTTILENDAGCCMEVSSGGGDVLRAKKLALILGD